MGFLKGLILLPVAIVAVLLAVANRAPVTMSFDPFSQRAPEFSVTLPLFALLFLAVVLGILIGGIGAWLNQGKNRRSRRDANRALSRMKVDSERSRAGSSNLPALQSSHLRA
jgi:uncharacterized integral membrane protein